MRDTVDQRAIEVLGDYLYELETRDRRQGLSGGINRTLAGGRIVMPPSKPPSKKDRKMAYAATSWEKEKVQEWTAQGRINADGYLRVGQDPLNPYTLAEIKRIMPHLGEMDRLAVLIDLDGIVEEGFMAAHENIRKVVEHIAKNQVELVLQSPDAKAIIADVVHEQVGVVFGNLLAEIQSGGSRRSGKRKNCCGNCGAPGHFKKTCPKSKEEGALMRAALRKTA